MSISTITNKDNLVEIPNNPSDAYQIGYAIGYQDGKCDAASPWHRVEVELPKPRFAREWYLVSLESGCVKSLAFERDENKWWATGSPVKYWMPLPEPPKEEQNDNNKM